MFGSFLKVATRADLANAGGSLKVFSNGKGVALFDVDGRVFAVENACPHRGAPLAGGKLRHEADGVYVVCADHDWRFRLADGVCPEAGPECTLMQWDVKIEGEEILLSRLPRMSQD